MLNGIYHNPTIIYFGKGMISQVGAAVLLHAKKVLLHFGSESFKKYGLYQKITDFLKASKIDFVELGGVHPNPRADLVYEGIKMCRKHNIDFILAVGGGSVIDSAKAISLGVIYEGDFFDIFEGKQAPLKSLKVASVLTIPGTGSESNSGTVITHSEKRLKLSYSNPLMFPVFSILDPEATYTLTEHQTACGIVDAMTHILERYFTLTTFVDCSDRICEGLLKTLMKYAYLVQKDPRNYNIRAEIMWASKLAQDNTAGFGRKQDWASHMIAHELGARNDIPHGEILSVIFPAWMQHVYHANIERFVQFAERVFDIPAHGRDPEIIILSAIDRLRQFFRDVGMPTMLSEIGVSDRTQFEEIASHCVKLMPSGTIGNFVRLSTSNIVQILSKASSE